MVLGSQIVPKKYIRKESPNDSKTLKKRHTDRHTNRHTRYNRNYM